jgi:hypothetical protein
MATPTRPPHQHTPTHLPMGPLPLPQPPHRPHNRRPQRQRPHHRPHRVPTTRRGNVRPRQLRPYAQQVQSPQRRHRHTRTQRPSHEPTMVTTPSFLWRIPRSRPASWTSLSKTAQPRRALTCGFTVRSLSAETRLAGVFLSGFSTGSVGFVAVTAPGYGMGTPSWWPHLSTVLRYRGKRRTARPGRTPAATGTGRRRDSPTRLGGSW